MYALRIRGSSPTFNSYDLGRWDFSNTSNPRRNREGVEGSLRVKKGVVSVRIWRCARLILGCQQKSPAKRGGQQKHEELGFHLDFFLWFFFGGAGHYAPRKDSMLGWFTYMYHKNRNQCLEMVFAGIWCDSIIKSGMTKTWVSKKHEFTRKSHFVPNMFVREWLCPCI